MHHRHVVLVELLRDLASYVSIRQWPFASTGHSGADGLRVSCHPLQPHYEGLTWVHYDMLF